MLDMVKAAVWHLDSSIRGAVCSRIESQGGATRHGDDGNRLVAAVKGDANINLLLCGANLRAQSAANCLLKIATHRPVPTILITSNGNSCDFDQGLEDHIMAYLGEPIQEAEILPTICLVMKRFEQLQELRGEVDELRETLSARTIIESAKAMMMQRDAVDESVAYQRLRRMAMNYRIKIVDAARRYLDRHASDTQPA